MSVVSILGAIPSLYLLAARRLSLLLPLLALGGSGIAHAERPADREGAWSRGAFRQTTAGGLSGLALPDPYLQHIQDRIVIDSYQSREHAVAPSVLPSARPQFASPPRVDGAIRVIRPALRPEIAKFRLAHSDAVIPPRGFMAPILEAADRFWPARLETNALSKVDLEAARLIEQNLAADGLIATLARLLQKFGPEWCAANPTQVLPRLQTIGFPIDWLQHFRVSDGRPADDRSARAGAIVAFLSQHLAAVEKPGAPEPVAFPIEFDFQPTAATGEAGGRFEIATECGDHEIGLVRMQVGGGWRNGIVPGGSIDIIAQMADQFRGADFLLSIEAEASGWMQNLVTNSWRLRRRGQVTLCEEVVGPSAWAQDNGKAGRWLANAQGARRATITPRFSCMDEGKSVFVPPESYMADGWRAAGQVVVHSPLLFQGGNMLCVRKPLSNRRLLVIGESTLHRNVALGLTRAQAVAAFTAEFGVDETVVVPGVSYHLDFDVTFRTTASDLVAFVNDTPAAARQIVNLGVAALREHQRLDEPTARTLARELESGEDASVIRVLQPLVAKQRSAAGEFLADFSKTFSADPVDDAAGNLQVFLLALDVLESGLAGPEVGPAPADNETRSAYLSALRRMEKARRDQTAALRRLGCKIVPVPSMQDLYRSVNYLNGLQYRSGYVMPGFGGLYGPLDRAAAAAFRGELGADFHVAVVRTSECQRLHGGVHCTASVYP